MRLTGSEIVCESLLQEGVDVVFGLPGGAILPLYGVMHRYPQLRHILVRHEQGASMAADGYARATGKVGVCMATSGPGATNLVTGIAWPQMDSVPMVAITGQVGRAAIGRDAFPGDGRNGYYPASDQAQLSGNERGRDCSGNQGSLLHCQHGRPGPVWWTSPRMFCSSRRQSSNTLRR